jgi:two-component system response regulator YesN
VILISAYQDFEYARKGLKLGILDYLLKPVDECQIRTVLQNAEVHLVESRSNLLRRSLFPMHGIKTIPNDDIEKSLESLKPYYLALYLPQPRGDFLSKLWQCSDLSYPDRILELETQPDGSRLFLFSGRHSIPAMTFEEKGIHQGYLVLSEIEPVHHEWESLCDEMNDTLWDKGRWGESGLFINSGSKNNRDDIHLFDEHEWELKSGLTTHLEEDFLPVLSRILKEKYEERIPVHRLKEGILELYSLLVKDFGIKRNIPESQIRRVLERVVQDLVKLNFDPLEISSAITESLTDAIPEKISHSYSIQKVKDFMNKNYSQNIDTTSLADMTGVSTKILNQLFLQEFGMSPSKYLIEIRIEIAKRLLITRGDLQIKEIANETGYEDPLYFSRIFHRKVGMNPTQYRIRNSVF